MLKAGERILQTELLTLTLPVTYVDTGLYEGGQHDWYEAYSEGDVRWARRLDYVLLRHKIPRW